jgi:hypothetical protein
MPLPSDVPDPAGSLVPPPRHPPTAVGAATPEPAPERRPARATIISSRRIDMLGGVPLRQLFDRAFDAIDEVADTVAVAVGLRK